MSEEKDRVDGTADETKAETKSSDHHTEDTYEKVCFMCRRPESKAGKMITLPGNINICPDCMQKSFDAMNQNPGQINEMMNNMNNMPNIGMLDLSGLSNQIPNRQRVKKKEEKCFNGCKACTNKCPVHLKYDEAGMREGECISCGRCFMVCPHRMKKK